MTAPIITKYSKTLSEDFYLRVPQPMACTHRMRHHHDRTAGSAIPAVERIDVPYPDSLIFFHKLNTRKALAYDVEGGKANPLPPSDRPKLFSSGLHRCFPIDYRLSSVLGRSPYPSAVHIPCGGRTFTETPPLRSTGPLRKQVYLFACCEPSHNYRRQELIAQRP